MVERNLVQSNVRFLLTRDVPILGISTSRNWQADFFGMIPVIKLNAQGLVRIRNRRRWLEFW